MAFGGGGGFAYSQNFMFLSCSGSCKPYQRKMLLKHGLSLRRTKPIAHARATEMS